MEMKIYLTHLSSTTLKNTEIDVGSIKMTQGWVVVNCLQYRNSHRILLTGDQRTLNKPKIDGQLNAP
jgi:hypothetical protein